MNVEILGTTTKNKGALLMLEAILEQLNAEFPDARVAVPTSFGGFAERAQYGLWGTLPRDRGRADLSPLMGRVPRRLREMAGLMAPSQIDVVLDASGFGYGDYWGLQKITRRIANPLARWRRRGKVAILLPQALGPFEKPGMAAAMRNVLNNADLVFARDEISLGYLNALAPGHRGIRRAPDFTNLLSPALPDRYKWVKGLALVTPNQKMIATSPPEVAEAYVDFMGRAIAKLLEHGRRPAFLIHELARDRELADRINAKLDTPIELIDEPSPLITKAIIAHADLLVASRFHALVSALSSGVPAFASGWSHKYEELMADYGCQEWLVDYRAPHVDARLVDFLDWAADPSSRAGLKGKAATQKAESAAMWREVIATIREGVRG